MYMWACTETLSISSSHISLRPILVFSISHVIFCDVLQLKWCINFISLSLHIYICHVIEQLSKVAYFMYRWWNAWRDIWKSDRIDKSLSIKVFEIRISQTTVFCYFHQYVKLFPEVFINENLYWLCSQHNSFLFTVCVLQNLSFH